MVNLSNFCYVIAISSTFTMTTTTTTTPCGPPGSVDG